MNDLAFTLHLGGGVYMDSNEICTRDRSLVCLSIRRPSSCRSIHTK
jgi:hypothetical protein